MKKLPKKWSLAKSWSPQEWVPREEAVARIIGYTGSGDVAVRDLRQDMLAGRLRSAAAFYRGLRDKGPVQRVILKPAFWEKIEIWWHSTGQIRVSGKVEGDVFVGAWVSFVRRADLNKLYPVAASASETPEALPPRRKPGPKTTQDWPMVVARELIRIARAGEREPSAADMCQFCETNLRWQPDIRDMRRLLHKLLA